MVVLDSNKSCNQALIIALTASDTFNSTTIDASTVTTQPTI